MQAKELQIGDWVIADYEVGKQTLAKVGFIDQRYADRAHDKIGFIPVPMIDNLKQYVNDERSIHPIPLTEKILKKNGFVYDEIADSWYNDRIDNLYEDKNGYYKYVDGYEIRFDSVHKFQQYLRICGLNDLADGFKV